MFHFTDGERQLTISSLNLSSFKTFLHNLAISRNINLNSCIVEISKNENDFKLEFILSPTYLSCSLSTDGKLNLTQDNINFASLNSNSKDDPYLVSIESLNADSVQLKNLIVNFDPIEHLIVIMKHFISNVDTQNFMIETPFRINFENINDIEKKLPSNYLFVFLKDEITKEFLPIRFPLNEDFTFSVINLETNEVVRTIPLKTYTELFFVMNPPQLLQDYTLTEEDVKALKTSLSIDLLPPGERQKRRLMLFLLFARSLYKTGSYYAPFTTVCQSSGVGKTRLLLECGSNFPLIYGVFRAASDRGYPPLSPWIKKFYNFILEAPKDDFDATKGSLPDLENSCIKTSVGRVLIFIDSLLKAYRKWFDEITLTEQFKNDLSGAYKYLAHSFACESGQDAFMDYLLVDEKDNRSIKAIKDSISISSGSFSKSTLEINKDNPRFTSFGTSLPFLLVLDEASLLLEFDVKNRTNPLFLIRRALHYLNPDCNLLCVAIGTNSDISSYHQIVNDNSLRFTKRRWLLPPFILTCNWDVFFDKLDLNSFRVTIDNFKSCHIMNLLCMFGRPVWSSLKLETLFSVARSKLLNGSKLIFEPAMAIWAIRTNLTMNSNLILARTLIKSYMAIVLSISYDTETMFITYPSEPILALTARLILRQTPQFSLHNFFNALLQYVVGRPIDKGRIVEAIFSQIILLAIDRSANLAQNVRIGNNGNAELENLLNLENYIFENQAQKPEASFTYPRKESSESTEMKESTEPVKYVTELEQISNQIASISVQEPNVSSIPVENREREISFYDQYLITSVDSFLLNLYGSRKYSRIRSSISPRLNESCVNASHFISLSRDFPFAEIYGKDRNVKEGSLPKSKILQPGCNIIDKALLRYGFIRQAAFLMPPNYFGYDAIIPVLMKRYKSLSEADSAKRRRTIEEEDVFTFIGIQFKAYSEKLDIVMPKMDIKLHYVVCPFHQECGDECEFKTIDEDLKEIYENYLSLYFAAEDETKFVAVPPPLSPQRAAKTQAFKNISDTSEMDCLHVDSYGNGHTCIYSSSLNALKNDFLDDELCQLIIKIIHSRQSPFHSADPYMINMTADGALNSQFGVYSTADKYLRSARGLEPLPDVFENLEGWNEGIVTETITRATEKYNKFKTLETIPGLNSNYMSST